MADRDYADAGVYFVTIRAQGEIRFGELAPDSVALNDAGLMIGLEWTALRERFKTIALDAFIVMPDHFHGIVVLRDPTTLTHEPRPIGHRQAVPLHPEKQALTEKPGLGSIVQAFKSLTTRAYAQGVRDQGWPEFEGRIWQRNYYERIVRSHEELVATRAYILTNPQRTTQNVIHPGNREAHDS